jgi:ribose-phosphate pyrophosphokinase
MELVGDVSGKNVILVDDIADTLGTLKKASELIMSSGAKSVRAIATHGVLSGKSIENLESSPLTELFVSDTVEKTIDLEKISSKIKVISCYNFIADIIHTINQKKSIHEVNYV